MLIQFNNLAGANILKNVVGSNLMYMHLDFHTKLRLNELSKP